MVWSSSCSLAVVLTLLLLRATALGAAADEPGNPAAEVAARQTIEAFHRELVGLAAGPHGSLATRVTALAPLVSATHDFDYIARFTLRRQWDELTTAQRTDFVKAFRELSVMTYAIRFGAVTAETFSIRGVSQAGRGRIQVEAVINRPEGTPITLSYLLQASGDGWRIINIIADGVSDLALKRAEYQRVFADLGFAGLLDHIQQLTAGMGNRS